MKLSYSWIISFFVGLGAGFLPWWAILLLIATGVGVLLWLNKKI